MASTTPQFDLAAAGFDINGVMDGVQSGLGSVAPIAVVLTGISIGLGLIFSIARRSRRLVK